MNIAQCQDLPLARSRSAGAPSHEPCLHRKDEKGDIVGIYSDEPIRFFEANERDILNCCGAYEFTPGKTLRVGPEHVDAALGGDPIKYYDDDDMCIE